MNDIVITYDSGLNTEGQLRHILRSIENHCTGYNEIVIVGDLPEFIQGVVHIGFNGSEQKFLLRNQYRKLRAACLSSSVSDSFYWVDASDTMIPFDARRATRISIPDGSIFSYRPVGTEKISLKHTRDMMKRRGFLSDGDFFNKYPMSFSKQKLKNTFDDIDFETKYGYCIKTLYANFNRLPPKGDITELTRITKTTKKSSYERD